MDALAELTLPSGLLCLDVAVEVRNRTEFEKDRAPLRIVLGRNSADAAVLYPVIQSTCPGRILGLDLALVDDPQKLPTTTRVQFRGRPRGLRRAIQLRSGGSPNCRDQ